MSLGERRMFFLFIPTCNHINLISFYSKMIAELHIYLIPFLYLVILTKIGKVSIGYNSALK